MEYLQPGRDRRRARHGKPVIRRLADQLTVDQVGDGLTHLGLAEILVVEVELQAGDVERVGVAIRREHQVRQRLQPLHVVEADRGAVAEIGLPGLERHGAGGGIGDELDDELVEEGLRLAPVILVADIGGIGAARPLLEAERPSADRRVVGGVGNGVALFVDVLRQNRRFGADQRLDQVRRGLGQAEHRRHRVRRVHGRHVGEGGPAARVQALQQHDAEGDIGGGEILPVMPPHAGPQVEGVAESVRRRGPRRRQQRQRIEVVVVFQ